MSGWTLADMQRFRQEIEMRQRLDAVAREHRMRAELGDDVYDFMTGEKRAGS